MLFLLRHQAATVAAILVSGALPGGWGSTSVNYAEGKQAVEKKPVHKAVFNGRRENSSVVFYADGTVLARDARAQTTLPVAGATVTLTGSTGGPQTITSGPGGKFGFQLDSGMSYSIRAERSGYFAARATLSTVGRMPSPNQLPITLTMHKISKVIDYSIEDVLYDYNKYAIRPDAASRLDDLVQAMKNQPDIAIELLSHTDQRGSEHYNRNLSRQRAQAIADYMVKKGIAESRITARSYGETRPLVRWPKTEADYQRNRRTEFKVTRMAGPQPSWE
ncbi:OmpA family protein [Hymenobacter negativus]|uniref:OmpA family protein n=1 Tax=Hymenobacter negativus TaxID=2795026 RepID=A0ABS3Q9P6_9BACT|nr:OmpA family protein [Hymenobacter negativus]MBO2007937.1 OmpA family protein [Hymenobacter negativus]